MAEDRQLAQKVGGYGHLVRLKFSFLFSKALPWIACAPSAAPLSRRSGLEVQMRAWGLGLALAALALNMSAAKPEDRAERLRLAREWVKVAHRQELMRSVYAKQLRAGMTLCHDAPCQIDLDKAILAATDEISKTYADQIVELFARRMTAKQLAAVLAFGQSAEGQAFIKAEDDMTDDLARLSHADSVKSQTLISQRFCPSHPEVCAGRFGNKLPGPPKA